MKQLVLSAFLAVGALLVPGTALPAAAAVAQIVCDENVPAAWWRPGGYCEQLNRKSLSEPVEGCPPTAFLLAPLPSVPGARVRVATLVDPCAPPV